MENQFLRHMFNEKNEFKYILLLHPHPIPTLPLLLVVPSPVMSRPRGKSVISVADHSDYPINFPNPRSSMGGQVTITCTVPVNNNSSILFNKRYCVKTQFGASILDYFQGNLVVVVSLADTLKEGVEVYNSEVNSFVESLLKPYTPSKHAFTVKVVDSKNNTLSDHPPPSCKE
jgi:hypothetical protein